MAYVGDEHPVTVGDRTTAVVLARLLWVYPQVLIPFGENQRYDLLIDDNNRFIRVQCKTGRFCRGGVEFNTCSFTYHHPNNQGTRPYKHHYRGAADLFGVYCARLDRVYLVPVDEVGRRACFLRIAPTKNAQAKKVRWARDYELRSPG